MRYLSVKSALRAFNLWSALECAGVRWSALECAGVRWSALECAGVRWSALRVRSICCVSIKYEFLFYKSRQISINNM